jgi:hypothetical protein
MRESISSEASVGTRRETYEAVCESRRIADGEDKDWQAEALRKRAAGEELDVAELQFVWQKEAEERGE